MMLRLFALLAAFLGGGAAIFLFTVISDMSEAGFWVLLAIWAALLGLWPLRWLHHRLAAPGEVHLVWRVLFGLVLVASPCFAVAWLVEAQVWLTHSDHVGMGPVALAMGAPPAALLILMVRSYRLPLCESIAAGLIWAAAVWPMASYLHNLSTLIATATLLLTLSAAVFFCVRRTGEAGPRHLFTRLIGVLAGVCLGTACLAVVLLATSGWSGFF